MSKRLSAFRDGHKQAQTQPHPPISRTTQSLQLARSTRSHHSILSRPRKPRHLEPKHARPEKQPNSSMKDPGCSISRDASRAPPRFPGKPDSPCLGMPSRTPMRFPGKRRYASGRLFTVSSQSEASAKTTKGFAPPRVTDRCQERPIHRREHVRGIWFTDSKGRKRKPETQERELKGQKRNFDGTRTERGAMATKGTGARRLVTLHGLSALQYWSFARCSCKSREQLLGTAKTRWADTKLALESASVKPPARLHVAPP